MKLRDLCLKIKDKQILDDVSFDIGRTALVGPNGSGKTMTLSVISQLAIPQSGELQIGSKNLLQDESFKENIGVMIQNGFFDPQKRVIEEMRLCQELKHDKSDILKILKKYDIQPDMLIEDLPHGRMKILLVIQALMGDPSLVVLDEPFSGLDVLNRRLIENILKSYKGRLLITSHQLSEIKNICKDIVFIKEGKVLKIKRISQIKNLDDFYVKLYS